MENQGIQVIPFYFLADVSQSMEGAPIKAINTLLPSVKEAMQSNPAVADMIRFSLISFSDMHQVDLPLSDLIGIPTSALPPLGVRGGTNFTSALQGLKKAILKDFTQLKADGFRVKRPVALFMSDGAPNEPSSEWRAAFADLISIPQFPNIVPIGIGDCDRATLSELRHRKDGPAPAPALFLNDGVNVGGMINELIQGLTRSMVASAAALSQPNPTEGGHAKAMFDGLTQTPGWDAEYD